MFSKLMFGAGAFKPGGWLRCYRWIGILPLLLIVACTLENPTRKALPTWKVTLEFPLLETEVTLKDLLADSLVAVIPYDQSGDSIFVVRDTFQIERHEVGDQLRLDPFQKQFVQYAGEVVVDSSQESFTIAYDTVGLDDIHESIRVEMGLIELTNITPDTTDPFLFREVMPNAGEIESALQAGGGTADLMIDTVALIPRTQNFTFTTIQDIVIESGWMAVTVMNNLFIDLGAPLVITVRNLAGDSLFAAVWQTEIPTGSSATTLVDLAGTELPGQLQVTVSGTSNGSRGDTITVTTSDLDSYFRVVLEPREIQVSQADAQVPAQTIRDTSSIQLAASETKVQQAELRTAQLVVNINNTMTVSGTMTLTVTSLVSAAGDAYTLTFPVPLGLSQTGDDLTGWQMVMDLADQRIDYHYTLLTDDTEPDYVQLTATDSVSIQLALVDITFNQVLGIIESQQITDSGAVAINSDSQIQSATIASGTLSIRVDNRIGGEARVALDLPRLQLSGSPVTSVLNISPGLNETVLDLSGHELVLPLNDQRLPYTVVTTTEPDQLGQYNLRDSIQVRLQVSELTFQQVTGYIAQDAVVEEDTIALHSETRVQQALVQGGTIRLVVTNYLGMVADVTFTLQEFTQNGTPLQRTFRISDIPEPETTLVDLAGYQLQLPLDDQAVHYTSAVILDSTQILTLSLEDSIEVQVLVDTLHFSAITGIIEPVTVEFDTVEYTISTLPEELEGIEFKSVTMAIDFSSDIGFPVFLNLALQAINPEGASVTSQVTDWNIRDSARVIIPNATALMNLQPNRIIATGAATVGAADFIGTVTPSQFLEGELTVEAPLELLLSGDARIESDPERVEEEFPSELDQLIIYARMDNQFSFGAQLEVLVAADSSTFRSSTSGVPDTLFVLDLVPNSVRLDSIVLGEKEQALLSDSAFVKSVVYLVGKKDPTGQPLPTPFLATDSLKVLLYGSGRVLVDLR
jgi:hypothetical protein